MFETRSDRVGEGIGAIAPRPVTFRAVREIHTRLGAEAEHVLQGHDGGVCNGREYRADEVPMNLAAVAVQVIETKLTFALDLFRGARRAFARYALDPTDSRV